MKTSTLKPQMLVFLMILTSMTALAYNFKSDGLYYNILSETDRTVEVTYYDYKNNSYYNDAYGDIEIPSKLIYDRKTYKSHFNRQIRFLQMQRTNLGDNRQLCHFNRHLRFLQLQRTNLGDNRQLCHFNRQLRFLQLQRTD